MHLFTVGCLFLGLGGTLALEQKRADVGLELSHGNCHCLPTDGCWPVATLWKRLNQTVHGSLIRTVPIGSPCHDPTYEEAECAALQAAWLDTKTHIESPSSIMQVFFANQSCDPFTPRESPCRMGNYVAYSINATTADDVVAGVRFARKHNIRFVVRNTGHDIMARSTGAGALSVWTQHLNSIEAIHDYVGSSYSGPAVRIGAGVQGWQLAEALAPYGLAAVTGECPSVGAAGGFVQGGGHSTLSTSYGLGADQTLEFEVVTANGDIVTASPKHNEDLYWALSGGGGGTYGVVTSLTMRAHPVKSIGGGAISFPASATTPEKFDALLLKLHELMPGMIDNGATFVYVVNQLSFSVSPLTVVNATGDYVRETVAAPLLKAISKAGITPTTSFTTLSSYSDHLETYLGPLPYGNLATPLYQVGGRMIGRKDVETSNSKVSSALSYLVSNGVILVGTAGNFAAPGGVRNAVYPPWREAVAHVSLLTLWDEDPSSLHTMVDAQMRMTDEFVPRIRAATPHGGSYLNEADYREPNWKHEFFGSNYPKLLSIKKKWDPDHFFFGYKMVGSDAWHVDEHGRMCRSSCSRR